MSTTEIISAAYEHELTFESSEAWKGNLPRFRRFPQEDAIQYRVQQHPRIVRPEKAARKNASDLLEEFLHMFSTGDSSPIAEEIRFKILSTFSTLEDKIGGGGFLAEGSRLGFQGGHDSATLKP